MKGRGLQADPRNPQSAAEEMAEDKVLRRKTQDWMNHVKKYNYTYGFTWLGRPIIQQPQDMVAMQEIIWAVKPDLIIETGIAHGGSIIYYASILELLGGDGIVIGVDIDIRDHNRVEIEKHPMMRRIIMIEGSSIEKSTIEEVYRIAANKKRIMVVLDSNHTHEHVLAEVKLYSPLVSRNSYLVVFDTRIEDMPPELFEGKPWGKGNNPKTAISEFLKTNHRFIVDKSIPNKILISAAPDGYLKCIRD